MLPITYSNHSASYVRKGIPIKDLDQASTWALEIVNREPISLETQGDVVYLALPTLIDLPTNYELVETKSDGARTTHYYGNIAHTDDTSSQVE